MKKSFALFALALCLVIPSVSCAVNLSKMSFDDLIDLRRQIELELMNRKDWQEVLVQEGIYEVGVDIPAGHWTIMAADGTTTHVKYGNKRKTDEADIHIGSTNFRDEYLNSPNAWNYDMYEDKTQTDIDMENGSFFVVKWSSCVLVPYTGKPYFEFVGDDGFTKISATPSPTHEPIIETPTPAPTPFDGYINFDFARAARYPEEYRNTRVLIEGTVVQVLGSKSEGYDIRLSTKGTYDDVIYVYVSSDKVPYPKILEDDTLRIKAVMKGEHTYTSISDKKITLPLAFADSVEILNLK